MDTHSGDDLLSLLITPHIARAADTIGERLVPAVVLGLTLAGIACGLVIGLLNMVGR